MDKKIFSKCGMRCDLCLIYRPNVEKEDRRTEICNAWMKMWKGFELDPNTIICDGCSYDKKDAILFSPDCEARKCVMEKGFMHCGYCEKYPCNIFPAEPTKKEVVQKIEVEKQWTWGDEKLMEAYACKKNMDEFKAAQEILMERFGKDSVISLATTIENTPYVRNVNAFYFEGAFYVLTYVLSNKMRQIEANPNVAIAGDWFTAHGKAINLGHFEKAENQEIAKRMRVVFSEWIDNGHSNLSDANTCILKIQLTEGLLLSHGTRYEIFF